ncbi:trans-1,2-dihydrobenzene-1,2-diol dehydrogenase [Caloenas nicobarica]|uniref:trans-1,2-dihydrobenzene-1,2-diol dehydrogenase n=1 Tax=Caloenas nicobarica TaxID=187106 RepID=UPI0032B84963
MEPPPPRPDAGVPSHPDAGVPSCPDAGVPSRPDAGVPSRPDAGVHSHPDAGVPSRPDTGVPSHPDAGVPSHPDAGVPSRPDAGVPLHPDAGVPSRPDAGVPLHPDAGVPSRPDAGVPLHPDAGVPSRPDAGVPLHPDAGVPSRPDAGVPLHPDAGVPCRPDAGVPSRGPTRWGICSAGHISHDFVVALRTLPPEEHVAVAVAARDRSRAVSFSRRHRIPRAYGSYRELAQDPAVDVVYVGVVTPQHLPLARLFLSAARPVLLEKPMALNWEQVRELVETARGMGVFLMEGYWTRFLPAWGRLRALVAGGALGDPLFFGGALGVALGGLPRLRDPLGGGALLDLGGYGLQMATALLGGAPRKLRAQGTLHPSGVDETVTMTLDFPGKRQAVFSVSIAAELPGGATLGGTRGWAQFPSHMNCPTELVLGGGPQDGGPQAGGPRRELFPLPPPDQPLNFPHGTGLRYEAQHVRECLLKGLTESPVMPFADSELVAQLLDEARAQMGVGGSPKPPPRPLPPPGGSPTPPGPPPSDPPPENEGTPQKAEKPQQ